MYVSIVMETFGTPPSVEGNLLANQGLYGQAVEAFTKAINLNPNDFRLILTFFPKNSPSLVKDNGK